MPLDLNAVRKALHNLEPIRHNILRNTGLRGRLNSIDDWQTFVTAIQTESEFFGVSIEDLEILRRTGPLIDRLGLLSAEVEPITDVKLLGGWIPLRVCWRNGAPVVHWSQMGDRRFTDPFFTQTAAACMQRPFNLIFRQETCIELVGEFIERWPGSQPDGIIYHMSRCGSTLVARMFATSPDVTVLSEPDPVDALLDFKRHNAGICTEQAMLWVRWIVEAIARPNSASRGALIVKADSWHMLRFEVLRAAFPDTPWIFLYREPVEVLVSLQRMIGRWAMPGAVDPDLLGLTLLEACSMPQPGYHARLLNSICEAALYNLPDGGAVLNYADLPEAALNWLPQQFGICISQNDVDKMLVASARNARQPELSFTPDSADKRAEASDALQYAAATILNPVFERLELTYTDSKRTSRFSDYTRPERLRKNHREL